MELAESNSAELSTDNTRLDHVDFDYKRYDNVFRNSRSPHLIASSDSINYRKDPFNQVELVNTLRGKELLGFIVLYFISVIFILSIFEIVNPIVFV